MPIVHELFGKVLTSPGHQKVRFHLAQCPHMGGKQCDGGGNRDMARWPAPEQPLAPFFDSSVGKAGDGFIPCGVCSVMTDRSWAICPRRLLTFDTEEPSPEQTYLMSRVLNLAGFKAGDVVRIWSEISIASKTAEEKLNYRLDYVLKSDDAPPVIVEIMTASTSGGNRKERTDIQNAFCDAVLYAEGNVSDRRRSPGVNTRQVWARMASQMVVKSQIANAWGGLTIWVVQDALMDYIRSNTGLRLDDLRSPDWQTGEVNVISASIDDPQDVRLYSGPVLSRHGEASWAELLNTPTVPPVAVLEDKLTDGKVIAEIHVS